MSTIEQMSIQGIRSFGPEAHHVQKIKFLHPVTLILGPNGTGKTSIIECLKYATTGEMPPGCKTGGTFVHDPKLTYEREIKGQVKLMVKDVAGAVCTVERSLIAEIKNIKGKLGQKNLDCVLTRLDGDGNKTSLTSKCGDLNKAMIGTLGVSKAVIENVIFCHQEDSNWPLGEGKIVKDKFDAIFASTRYTKVLEELKKLKQSQDQEIKLGKQDLDYLKQHKDKALQFRGDIEELETKLAASLDSVTKIRDKQVPIREKLEQINKNANDIYKLKTKRDQYKSERNQIAKSIEELSLKIENVFEGSTNELKRELDEFSKQVQKKRERFELCEQEQIDINAQLEQISKTKNRLLLDVGKLQQEFDSNEEKKVRRNGKIYDLAEEYGFEGFSQGTEISDEVYKKFFETVKKKFEFMLSEGRLKKAEFSEKEAEVQSKMDSFRDSKTKLEHSIKMKKDSVNKNNKEIDETNKKLKQMGASADRLQNLNIELKRAEKSLQEVESSMDVDLIKTEKADFENQKTFLETSIDKLNSEMNKLHEQSSAQTQLNMLKDEQEKKEGEISRLKSVHQDNIVSLLGHVPVEDLRLSIDTYIGNQSESLRKCQREQEEDKNKLLTKEGEKKSVLEQVRQKEKELRQLEEDIYNVCESQDIEEELDEVQKNLTQAQEEKGSLLGADHMINKYIRNLEKNNPACPLCHRGFDRAQEVRELIIKLKEQLRKVPISMKKADEDISVYQKKYDDITQLKPIKKNVLALKEEIPNMKTKLKTLEEEIKKVKEAKVSRDDQLDLLEMDLQSAKDMQPDIVLLDRSKADVRDLEEKIAKQRELLPSGDTGRTLKKVIEEKEEKQLELETVNRNLRHRSEKLNNFLEQKQKLGAQINSLKSEKLTKEGELQEKIKLEETKAALTSENTNLVKDIEESKTQIQPLERQLQKLVDDKAELTKRNEHVIDEIKNNVALFKNRADDIKNLNSEIKAYKDSGKVNKLKDSQEKQSKLTREQAKKEEEQEEMTTKMNQLQKEMAEQQIRERELQDTLSLRNKEEEVKEKEKSISELEDKLQGFDVKNLEKNRQELLREEEVLSTDLHNATGRQQGFKDEIKRLRNELNSQMYKGVDKKYSDRMIKIKTTEMVNGDLQKYYKAMETAINRYHRSKMEEINLIIRELWRATYSGNDIDTIEIRTEEEDNTGPAIKNRKSYNYRVVMVKRGVALDMRGRCSAGQKVLASLIIRMALAECFCVNCGVLALDEPTTNLDRANIENLSFALSTIIKSRRHQKGFQLVVITHDEDFVDLVGRTERIEEYIQVSKNQDGLSCLNLKRIADLNSTNT